MASRIPYVLPIGAPMCQDVRVAGGKGASLARLVATGVPVPPAIVVTTGALSAHLSHHGLAEAARAGDPSLAERLLVLPLSPEFAGLIRKEAAHLPLPLAVRSSAVAEDGAEASHAGQFATVLGVQVGDALEDALRVCWSSAFGARVRAYRGAAGPSEVAVVVQSLVDAHAAGVLFTINPANGNWREMTVEAAWGLGESVVSGQVLPDFYRVRRPMRLPGILGEVAARVRLREVEREVNPQVEEQRPAPHGGGVVAQDVPPERVHAPKLSPSQVARVCRLGLRIEARAGCPQDIEWAIDQNGQCVILQSRPVTTARDVRPSGDVLWTRRFLGERWTEPATPLGWSLIQRELHWLVAYPDTSRRFLGGAPPTRLHRFAPYLNATIFRHLAFKFPGAPPPQFLMELLPAEEEAAWLRSFAAAPDLAVYRSIFATTFRERRWRRFRWNPLRNWAHWQAFVDDLPRQLRALPSAARPRADACQALAREYIKIHVCSLLFANLGYELVTTLFRQRGLSGAETVLRPLKPSATVFTHHDLWRLGRGSCPLDEVLDRHGNRAESSWELFGARWREQPALVKELAEAVASGDDPLIHATASIAEADAVFGQLPADLRPIVRLVRRYYQLREDQRAAFEHITGAWRAAWQELERETGIPLRLLDIDEADGLLAGRLDRGHAEALVAQRHADMAEERERRARGDEPPAVLGAAPRPVAWAHQLRGRGISSGVARGPACVLRSLAEAHKLRHGDVLVARATDPGWTPLFRRASALVLEQGGMLSHGAVVAREYGLPAVVNVSDATHVIPNGQVVTVDGGRGLVLLTE